MSREKKKTQERSNDTMNVAVASDGYESAEALIVHSGDICKEWILDSGCSFHMCLNHTWLETLNLEDGGFVLLGNNRTCRIEGK